MKQKLDDGEWTWKQRLTLGAGEGHPLAPLFLVVVFLLLIASGSFGQGWWHYLLPPLVYYILLVVGLYLLDRKHGRSTYKPRRTGKRRRG